MHGLQLQNYVCLLVYTLSYAEDAITRLNVAVALTATKFMNQAAIRKPIRVESSNFEDRTQVTHGYKPRAFSS